MGKAADKFIDVGDPGGRDDLRLARARAPEGDVVAEGSAEQQRILEHQADLVAQRGERRREEEDERVRALDCRLLALAVEAAQAEDLREIVEEALCDLLVIGDMGRAASEEPS
jgi:hypothetical protein